MLTAVLLLLPLLQLLLHRRNDSVRDRRSRTAALRPCGRPSGRGSAGGGASGFVVMDG